MTTRWKLREEYKNSRVYLPGAGRLRPDKILIGDNWVRFDKFLEPAPAETASEVVELELEPKSAYDEILATYPSSVSKIVAKLDELTAAECEQLQEYEAANKNRKTLLEAIDALFED